MSHGWYFTRGEQQLGPVEWFELQALAVANQLTPTDRIWKQGMPAWVEASSVDGLFAPLATAVPATAIQGATGAPTETPIAVASAMAATPAPATFPVAPSLDYGTFSTPKFAPAGFFMRALACIIDGLLIMAVGVVLSMGFMWSIGHDAASANAPTVDLVIRILFLLLSWIYYASMESGPMQSTLGKKMLGLKVTDLSGKQISFARASARYFGKILSHLSFLIGYLMMKFTPNGQCLHDMVSGCVVLKREWN